MSYIKREVAWLWEHAKEDANGAVWCKKTGAPIQTAKVGRSIHDGIFANSGSGEVRQVIHMACAGCDPGKTPPRYGQPILESELTDNLKPPAKGTPPGGTTP